LKLDRRRRCCYTIVENPEGLKVIVLEVFPDHKSYNNLTTADELNGIHIFRRPNRFNA